MGIRITVVALVTLAAPTAAGCQAFDRTRLVDQPTWEALISQRDDYAGDTIRVVGACLPGRIQEDAPELPWLRSRADSATARFAEAILLSNPLELPLACTEEGGGPATGVAVGLFVPSTVYLGILELVLPFPASLEPGGQDARGGLR